MDAKDIEAGFAAVDRAADATPFINYLDLLGALQAFQLYKRQTFELLGVRNGRHVLDVGCGNGDDVRAMAALVGPTGRAVGVDRSEDMIEEAKRRMSGDPALGEFFVGEATELPFDSAGFDGARADRVFQHLADPQHVLAEMIRVTRRGGRVVVADTDWETVVIESRERALTRRILNVVCDRLRNGWAGRQLPGLFKSEGLADIAAVPVNLVLTSYAMAREVFALDAAITEMLSCGAASAVELEVWSESLSKADAAGKFFAAATGFIVHGTRT